MEDFVLSLFVILIIAIPVFFWGSAYFNLDRYKTMSFSRVAQKAFWYILGFALVFAIVAIAVGMGLSAYIPTYQEVIIQNIEPAAFIGQFMLVVLQLAILFALAFYAGGILAHRRADNRPEA